MLLFSFFDKCNGRGTYNRLVDWFKFCKWFPILLDWRATEEIHHTFNGKSTLHNLHYYFSIHELCAAPLKTNFAFKWHLIYLYLQWQSFDRHPWVMYFNFTISAKSLLNKSCTSHTSVLWWNAGIHIFILNYFDLLLTDLISWLSIAETYVFISWSLWGKICVTNIVKNHTLVVWHAGLCFSYNRV